MTFDPRSRISETATWRFITKVDGDPVMDDSSGDGRDGQPSGWEHRRRSLLKRWDAVRVFLMAIEVYAVLEGHEALAVTARASMVVGDALLGR
jgi:hypothetical protein